MTFTSGTGSSTVTGTIKWTGWRKVPQKPNRIAGFIAHLMERLCEASGHLGACALLNGRLYVRCDADDCLTIPVPLTRRLYGWASDRAADWRFERWDQG